jgi:hypothetical protein
LLRARGTYRYECGTCPGSGPNRSGARAWPAEALQWLLRLERGCWPLPGTRKPCGCGTFRPKNQGSPRRCQDIQARCFRWPFRRTSAGWPRPTTTGRCVCGTFSQKTPRPAPSFSSTRARYFPWRLRRTASGLPVLAATRPCGSGTFGGASPAKRTCWPSNSTT